MIKFLNGTGNVRELTRTTQELYHTEKQMLTIEDSVRLKYDAASWVKWLRRDLLPSCSGGKRSKKMSTNNCHNNVKWKGIETQELDNFILIKACI